MSGFFMVTSSSIFLAASPPKRLGIVSITHILINMFHAIFISPVAPLPLKGISLGLDVPRRPMQLYDAEAEALGHLQRVVAQVLDGAGGALAQLEQLHYLGGYSVVWKHG